MATVIDALIVTLGLDGTKFKQGSREAQEHTDKMKKAAEKAAKDMQAEGKKAAEFFTKIRNEALLFFGVFTAGKGLAAFAEDNLHNAASLGRLSDNLQINIEELSSWQRAAERAGGSAAGITAQLQESQQAVAKFNTGISDENMLWFYNLGGSEKAFKSAKDYLLARADIIAETNKTDPGRAQLQAQQMGISPEQFNLIKKGSAGILELVAAQEKNSRFTRKQAEEAANLENKLRDLKDRFAVTGTTILLALVPAFEKMSAKLEKMADYFADHKDEIAKWVDGAVDAIGRFVTMIDSAAEAVGGWKNVLIALAAFKILSMASSLVVLAAGLTQVATALAAVSGGSAALGVLGKLGLLGAAGAAGYAVGTAINDATEDTSFHEKLGEVLVRTMASFGNKDAAESIALRTGRNDYSAYYTPPEKKTPTATAKPDAKESNRTIEVAKKLMSMGWTSAQAAGIAGSLNQESGLDPNARNKQSGAYGIGQWLGTRVKDFEKWAGHKIEGSSLDEQLKFQQFELTNGKEKSAGDRLRKSTTAQDAAQVHSQYYERPGKEEANVPRRQQMAALVAAQIQRENALAAASVPAMAAAQPQQSSTSKTTNTNSVETNINGPITIQTAATDAPGIAKSIGPALQKYAYASQANTGMI